DADAADLTQDVLRAVAGAVGKGSYDPQKGSFRGWLFTVVRNKLRDFLAREARRSQGKGGTSVQKLLEAQPAAEQTRAAEWDQEYEERLFAWAAEKVRGGFRDSTWQAFWQTAIEGQTPAGAAQALGMTVGAVYI